MKIEIPKGYIIDLEKSNLETGEVHFKLKSIDLSILNETDVFYIETLCGHSYLFTGKNFWSEKVKGVSLSYVQNKFENSICFVDAVKIFRIATMEEEQIFFKYYPELKAITWKELGVISGYYISSDSRIRDHETFRTEESNRNVWPTKEETEAALALSQLCQWRNKYNEGWFPNWKDDSVKKYQIFLFQK